MIEGPVQLIGGQCAANVFTLQHKTNELVVGHVGEIGHHFIARSAEFLHRIHFMHFIPAG
jgi:hypothetical protein